MRIHPLRHYQVSEEIFNNILLNHSIHVRETDNIYQYFSGYDKKTIIYHKNEYLICKECLLNYYTHNIEGTNEWRQCVVICSKNPTVEKTVSGLYAYNYIMKIIHKFYSEEEVAKILESYTDTYDANKKQVHIEYRPNTSLHTVIKFPNCVKYDINGAHTDALCEIFPRCKQKFTEMYNQRKEKPVIKAYFNSFVGYLKHLGYDGVYYYIVHRTTDILNKAMDYVKGEVLYANTDGFIVRNPLYVLRNSTELGQFKVEHRGPCYIFGTKNYWIYQMDDEIKGSMLMKARGPVDLRKGVVVYYDIEIVNTVKLPKNIKYIKEEIYEND